MELVCDRRIPQGLVCLEMTLADTGEVIDRVESNLVVDAGRAYLVRMLGGALTGKSLGYLELGNCNKAGNAPTLADDDLVSPLLHPTTAAVSGRFAIDANTEILYPAADAIYPVNPLVEWGGAAGTIAIDASGRTIFTDASVDFASIGAAFGQRLTVEHPGQNLSFIVRRVLSTTTLELHNPDGATVATSSRWRLDVSGTQLLVSKTIAGDSFPAATWGPQTLVTELALKYGDGTLFSRVLIARDTEGVGVYLQPATTSPGQVNLTVNWLISI